MATPPPPPPEKARSLPPLFELNAAAVTSPHPGGDAARRRDTALQSGHSETLTAATRGDRCSPEPMGRCDSRVDQRELRVATLAAEAEGMMSPPLQVFGDELKHWTNKKLMD